jgi:transposase InsO family protein
LAGVANLETLYVAGFAVGEGANSDLALAAWTQAEETLSHFKDSLEGVIVHQDQDPVFTSYAWTARLLAAGVRVSYALGGPRTTRKMESFFGRFKVENGFLLSDAGSLAELTAVVTSRIEYYNRVRRHSSLGDRPPLALIAKLYREG